MQTYRNPTKTITIIRPKGARKSFSLRLESVDSKGTKTTNSKIYKKNERLVAVNSQFKNNVIDYNTANHLVEKLKIDLEYELKKEMHDSPEENIELNKANLRLLNKYWKEVYEDKDVKARSAIGARVEFERLLRIFNDTPIATSSKLEIREKWDKADIPHQGKVRLSTRLNALLKFAKRDFTIKMQKSDVMYVNDKTFISEKDMIKMLRNVTKEEDIWAIRISFYTGIRVGELYGLKKDDYDSRSGRLKIRRQLVRGQSFFDEPKSKSARDIPIIKEIKDDLKKWVSLSDEYKKRDDKNFGSRLKNLSRRTFPHHTSKQISPHGLRRSFARHYYDVGLTISELAMLMGDTEGTVRNNYLGLKMGDNMFKSIKSKINGAVERT